MSGADKSSRVASDLKAQAMESSGPHCTQSAMKFTMDGTRSNSLKIRLRTTNTIEFPLKSLVRVWPKCSSMGSKYSIQPKQI
jgi:hypothetical protein